MYFVAKLFHDHRPGVWSSKEDILFLYKAMEALVASNHAVNPVIPTSQSSGAVGPTTDHLSPMAVTAVAAVSQQHHQAAETCNGGAAGAVNVNGRQNGNGGGDHRRHSLSDCRSNGSISNIGVGEGGGQQQGYGDGTSSRRHSLPPSSASGASLGGSGTGATQTTSATAAELEQLTSKAAGLFDDDDDDNEVQDDDDDRNSETAALTSSC